jgi:hypothetical protein
MLRPQVHEGGGCLIFEAEGQPKLSLKISLSCIARASPFGLCAQCAVGEGCSAAAFKIGQGPVDLGLFVSEVVDGEGDVELAGREERPAAFAVSIEVLWDSWLYTRLCRGD